MVKSRRRKKDWKGKRWMRTIGRRGRWRGLREETNRPQTQKNKVQNKTKDKNNKKVR